MTFRDANANAMLDLLDLLDLRRPTLLDPPPLARPLVEVDSGTLTCNVSGRGMSPPPGSSSPPHH